MPNYLSNASINAFKKYMIDSEKSVNTVEKYTRDLKKLHNFLGKKELTKELLIAFKKSLCTKYKTSSANSIIAAINCYLHFTNMENLCIKYYKIQHKAFCDENSELTRTDYIALCDAAKALGKERILLVIKTLCATGMRVSELKFVTVEAVQKGEAVVSLKGKIRTIFFVRALQRQLLSYASDKNIASGKIFVSEKGNSLNRTNIWRDMKALCEVACINPQKAYPHNLRHLFARTFYDIDKDIAKLADILGHSSINTTRIYIASSGDEHKKCMEKMELVT